MIPYSDSDYFYNDAIHKALLITDGTVTVSGTSYTVTGQTVKIENDLLDQEGFELHQSLCSENQIRFGACESNYITFIMHENIPTLKGKVLKVYLIPDSDASKMLQIGVFKVSEDKLSSDRTKRTITAYDAMYDILNADVAGWYNSLLPNSSSTVTLGQMRFALTAYFGLTQETITLPNDSYVVHRTIEPETLSGADMIRWICELEGCFGQITNEGKFRYVVLTPGLDDGLFPSDTLYPSDALYPQDVNPNVDPISKARYIDVQFEDYNSESITGLTIRTDDSDVGVTVGTNTNVYIITGNPLVYGCNATQLRDVAENTLLNMVNRYYNPCTVNAVGNPLHEVGDGIRVSTTYRGIVSYILERKLSGIQALRDTYSASGEQYYAEQLNSIGTQFKQISGLITSLKVETGEIKASVADLAEDTEASITVLSNQISSKVETSTFNSTVTQLSNSISSKVESSTFNSTVNQLSSAISAKVESSGGDPFSFGWTLNASGFFLISNTVTVMECNQYGLDITGEIHNSGTHGEAFYGDGMMELSTSDGHDVVLNARGLSATSPDKGDWGISKNGVTINYDLYKPMSITIDGDSYMVLGYAV